MIYIFIASLIIITHHSAELVASDSQKPYGLTTFLNDVAIPHLRSTRPTESSLTTIMNTVHEDISDGFPYRGPINPEFYGLNVVTPNTGNSVLNGVMTVGKLLTYIPTIVTIARSTQQVYKMSQELSVKPPIKVPASLQTAPSYEDDVFSTLDALEIDELQILADREEERGSRSQFFRLRYAHALRMQLRREREANN